MQWFHFEIGWFNLWILALIIFITPVLLNIARGERGKTGLRRATELPPMSQAEHVAYMLVMSPQFLLPAICHLRALHHEYNFAHRGTAPIYPRANDST